LDSSRYDGGHYHGEIALEQLCGGNRAERCGCFELGAFAVPPFYFDC